MKRIICILCLFGLLLPKSYGISAESYVFYDCFSGEILSERNSESSMLIASTTKIMTALVALELYDLDSEVTIKREWTGIEGSSMYLKPNEKLTVRELLYGLLLSSGNDAAVALACLYTGNQQDFVTLMNAKAMEIGANNTFFENPNGLDGENHKSTAKDMALIAAKALENEDFRQIVSTKSIKIGERYFANHNRLLSMRDDIIGVKTGYTMAAGRCLVSAADMGGRIYVAVTLSAPDDWDDHLSLYEQYGKEAQSVTVLPSDFTLSVPVAGGQKQSVTVRAESEVILPLLEDETAEIIVEGPRLVYGGAQQGERYGSVKIYVGGKEKAEAELSFAETVEKAEKRSFWDKVWDSLKSFKK